MKESVTKMKHPFILIFIVIMALSMRLYGLQWDQGTHQHPDERFLTMVANDAKLPDSFLAYLDPARSSLNPYNIKYDFFVYGTLPLSLVKVLAVAGGFDNYDAITLLGRFLSALFDVGTLIVLFLLVLLFVKELRLDERLAYVSAFLYAVTVLPIQQSHFFTSDSFLVFFMISSAYCAFRYYFHVKNFTRQNIMPQEKKYIWLFFSAVCFGCAMGTKINAVLVLPLILYALAGKPFLKKASYWAALLLNTIIFGIISLIAMRIADPKTFTDGIFSLMPSEHFLSNIKQLQAFNNSDVSYPPGVQWIKKTKILFSLTNIIFFGLGLPYFILLLTGMYDIIRTKKTEILMITGWVLLFFMYQGAQYVQTFRYFYPLYPFFAFIASFGCVFFLKYSGKPILTLTVISVAVLLWPVCFMSIYTKPHTRVSASYWIHQNIPQNSTIAVEHWDDALPLYLKNIPLKTYITEQMPVFDVDDEVKWNRINDILAQADYIILASNRGYGSIGTVPERYPKMTRFYTNLFAGNLNFVQIQEFTSYPSWCPFGSFLKPLCIVIPDQWAEEAFTVYDHPKVTIFKRAQ